MIVDSTADFFYEARKIEALTPDITEQHPQQSRLAETARKGTVLPIHSEPGAAPTADNNVGAARSVLSTFQQNSAAVLDAEHFRPSMNSNINNFQDLPLNIDHTALLHTHPISTGGYSDGMWHQISSSPTEAARYIGGQVDASPRELHQTSTAPASVLRDLTGCYPGAAQDVPFNDHTVDIRWAGVFGATWDSNERWMGSFGPTYNSDLNQGWLSHNQTADQQWSGAFGNGWRS